MDRRRRWLRSIGPPMSVERRHDAQADRGFERHVRPGCRWRTGRSGGCDGSRSAAHGGWQGPAVVTGLGSVPYLPTHLSGSPAARRLEQVVQQATRIVGLRHGATIRCDPVFAGISDMSFFGEVDEGPLGDIARNTPGWTSWIGWPEQAGVAGVPIINAGPWGRDYHTPLERLDVHYAFAVLPDLISDIVDRLFATGAAEPSIAVGASP